MRPLLIVALFAIVPIIAPANAADGCGPGCHATSGGACVVDGWGTGAPVWNECPAGARPTGTDGAGGKVLRPNCQGEHVPWCRRPACLFPRRRATEPPAPRTSTLHAGSIHSLGEVLVRRQNGFANGGHRELAVMVLRQPGLQARWIQRPVQEIHISLLDHPEKCFVGIEDRLHDRIPADAALELLRPGCQAGGVD